MSDTTTPQTPHDAAPVAASEGETVDDTPTRRFRVDKTLLVVSAIIGLGLALVIRGLFLGVTGDDRADLPEQISQIVSRIPECKRNMIYIYNKYNA